MIAEYADGHETRIYVISGPSAVGKSRVLRKMREQCPNIACIVSYTTRSLRMGEIPDVDYHFVDSPCFRKMILEHRFLEWKETPFGLYGTPAQAVFTEAQRGKYVVIDLDPSGFLELKKSQLKVLGAFLLPESLDVLYERIAMRGKDRGVADNKALEIRYRHALEIIGYAGLYDLVLINERVSDTAQLLVDWIKLEEYKVQKECLLCSWMEENKANLKGGVGKIYETDCDCGNRRLRKNDLGR